MIMDKVIGIGFHKTGTTSLRVALEQLGYKVLGLKPELVSYLINGDLDSLFAITKGYDAFQDNPWPHLYKEFDKRYPNSKFILTSRDEQRWINSVVNHFGNRHTDMRQWIYGKGYPEGNEGIYLEKYKNHYREVLDYFKDRKEDLLVVDWENGEGWTELCAFLNVPIPDKPFPHAKKGTYSNRKKGLMSYLKALLKDPRSSTY